MEYPAKMMSQHFTSMLEHLKVSSLINKTRNQASSSNPIPTSQQQQQQNSDSKVKSYGTDDIEHHKIIKNNGTIPILIENHTNNSSIKYESKNFNDTKVTNVVNNSSVSVNSEENNQLTDMNSAVAGVIINCETNRNNSLGMDTNSVRRHSFNTLNACPMTGQQSRKQSYVIKPIKLKNVSSQQEYYDTLYTRATEVSFLKYKIFYFSFKFCKSMQFCLFIMW